MEPEYYIAIDKATKAPIPHTTAVHKTATILAANQYLQHADHDIHYHLLRVNKLDYEVFFGKVPEDDMVPIEPE